MNVFRCARWLGTRQLIGVATVVILVTQVGSASLPSAGALGPRARTHTTAARRDARGSDDPHYCDGCTVPLVYGGGPVMATGTSAGLTVTPIYWAPGGSTFQFPDGFEKLINGYVHNVAAASGADGNVYSIDTEYYDVDQGAKSYLSYHFTAGAPIIDDDAYPANGCTPVSGSRACITDAQLRTELTHLLERLHLPATLAEFYPVFFAPGVETQDLDGSNSASSYCGYHRTFSSGSRVIAYADMPFESSGCDAGQAPNGSVVADGAVSTLSHELNESITDPAPTGADYAWNDSVGDEIGDICAGTYGPSLGSTSSTSPGTTEYNQVINGGKYYTQEEFSNLAFSKLGVGEGCQQSESDAQHATQGPGTAVASIFSDATPLNLAAGDTSQIRVVVGDSDGNAVSGDRVKLTTYVDAGSGSCGTLSRDVVSTGDDGSVTVTYTASDSNVECSVVATESEGGRSSQSDMFQGSYQGSAPTTHAAFPTSLEAGGQAKPFTVSFSNPSSVPLVDARVDVDMYQGAPSSKSVKASDVALTCSTTGPNGTYKTVQLTGSTDGGGDIQGYVGSEQGTTIPAHGAETLDFKVALTSAAPVQSGVPLLGFEDYLDQVDSASGSGTTLADTYETNVTVARAAPSSHTLAYVLGALVALVLIALVSAWLMTRRRRRDVNGGEGLAPTP